MVNLYLNLYSAFLDPYFFPIKSSAEVESLQPDSVIMSKFVKFLSMILLPRFPILHGAEMWKRGHNNLIRDALVFIPFKVGNDRREQSS